MSVGEKLILLTCIVTLIIFFNCFYIPKFIVSEPNTFPPPQFVKYDLVVYNLESENNTQEKLGIVVNFYSQNDKWYYEVAFENGTYTIIQENLKLHSHFPWNLLEVEKHINELDLEITIPPPYLYDDDMEDSTT